MAETLSYQEVEKLLESILVNKKLTKVSSRKGDMFVLFSHPTTEETIQSRYIREKALLEALEIGIPTREQLEQRLQDHKIFTDEDEKKITETEDKLAAQRRLLQLTKIEGRRKDVEENIARYEKEIEVIRSKSRNLFYMSAESKADEESTLYVAWVASHKIDGSKQWASFQDFENETDLVLRNSIIESFVKFNAGLSTQTIRFLARHNLWRIRYAAALKVGGPLFPKGLSDLTPDQLGLLYWSNYYQSIFEMLPDDQPGSDLIADDAALDSYMESYFKRRETERNEGRVKRASGKGKLSAWDKGEELIITANHPEYFKMQYSEERIKAGEGTTDVEVIAPNSRRARNRAAARRGR